MAFWGGIQIIYDFPVLSPSNVERWEIISHDEAEKSNDIGMFELTADLNLLCNGL